MWQHPPSRCALLPGRPLARCIAQRHIASLGGGPLLLKKPFACYAACAALAHVVDQIFIQARHPEPCRALQGTTISRQVPRGTLESRLSWALPQTSCPDDTAVESRAPAGARAHNQEHCVQILFWERCSQIWSGAPWSFRKKTTVATGTMRTFAWPHGTCMKDERSRGASHRCRRFAEERPSTHHEPRQGNTAFDA